MFVEIVSGLAVLFIGAGVNFLWRMSKDISGLRAEFTLHRVYVEKRLDDHEGRLRHQEKTHVNG